MKKTVTMVLIHSIIVIISIISCDGNKSQKLSKSAQKESIMLNQKILLVDVGNSVTITFLQPNNALNTNYFWSSSNESVVVVDFMGKITAISAGVATITASTKDGILSDTSEITVITTEESVIINGIKWATRNVNDPGTFTSESEDAGMFYQWNRKTAISSKGSVSDWNKTNPAGTNWTKSNDPCPNGWRLPTEAELQALIKSTGDWRIKNNSIGYLFGTAPNQIFLPFAGYRDYFYAGKLELVNRSGGYWSSSQYDNTDAWSLSISQDGAYIDALNRSYALSVRCVCDLK